MIDDSPEDQEMCRYFLAQEGKDDYVFLEAQSGEKGLQRCLEEKPDCVLLDYMLPDIDGLAMLKKMTDEHGQLLVPVVMLTGQGSESIAVQALKNGAQDYIPKDELDGVRIAHSVHYAIERKEAENAVWKLKNRWKKTHGNLDMDELLAGIAKAFEFQIHKAKVTLNIEPLPRCQGDEEKIKKIFVEIVDNAVRFLDPSRPGVITVQGYQDSGQTVFMIADNGIGIDSASQEHIFELSYRFDPSGSANGVGLACASRMLKQLKGKIWLKSEIGQGSTFYVSLPRL